MADGFYNSRKLPKQKSQYITSITATLFLYIFAGCSSNPIGESSNDLGDLITKAFPEAINQEKKWKDSLTERAGELATPLALITTGTPHEIKVATQERDELRAEYNNKLSEIRQPVSEIEAKISELKDHPIPGYYANEERRCGSDGCGGTCESQCRADEVCRGEWCSCVPDCEGRQCGPDGCGGYCGSGTCGEGQYCDSDYQCNTVETICSANCRSNLPESGDMTRVKPTRDFGTTNRTKRFSLFTSIDELKNYERALKDNINRHESALAESIEMKAKIDELNNKIKLLADSRSKNNDAIKLAKSELKTLSVQLKQAKKENQDATAGIEETILSKNKEIESLVAINRDGDIESKTNRAEINKMTATLKKSSSKEKIITEALAKLRYEHQSISKALEDWQKRDEKIKVLEGQLQTALMEFSEPKEDLDEKYLERLESLDTAVANLESPALAVDITPKWDSNNPLHSTAEFILQPASSEPLVKYIEALDTTLKRWQQGKKNLPKEDWEELADKPVPMAAETSSGKKYKVNWDGVIDALEIQLNLCRALKESASRLANVRMSAERLRYNMAELYR